MKILAIEFSSERRSVAVLEGVKLRGAACQSAGQSTRAFALIEQALHEAGVEREAVDCLAVGLGPGSYAGIRSAIAVAQGWQIARHVSLLGLCSVEALAVQAQEKGLHGRLHFLVDAQRNECYAATYEINVGTIQLVTPLRLLTAAQAATLWQDGRAVVGPELLARYPHAEVLLPDAAALGRLAANRTDFVSGDALEPIYLRETAFVKALPPRNRG